MCVHAQSTGLGAKKSRRSYHVPGSTTDVSWRCLVGVKWCPCAALLTAVWLSFTPAYRSCVTRQHYSRVLVLVCGLWEQSDKTQCCGMCWTAADAAPAVSGITSRQKLLSSGS